VKRLLLLRHAKSSWDDPDLDDRDRPLAKRGRRASQTIAEHLSRESMTADLVLCSSAQRARETLERIAPALGDGVDVQIEPELYSASEDRLLERVRAVAEDVESVLLIGHNPGLEQLALELAGSGDELMSLRGKYPTAALATLEFDGPWRALEPGRATLTSFIWPKQLAKR
jgi:phosphohistidine phosphatase